MRLLLVEDDDVLGDALQAGLRQDGYETLWVRDGLSADRSLLNGRFDLLVLDLGIPHRDGLRVLRDMRNRGDITPTLILTARDTAEDRVIGLDSGADDYLVKPFDFDELHARLRALTRRERRQLSRVWVHGEVSLDRDAHTVRHRGQLIELAPREFALLQLLLENPARVLSRAQLEHALYAGSDIESNAVEVHVHHLRKKFGADFIQTVRGVGYGLGKPPT